MKNLATNSVTLATILAVIDGGLGSEAALVTALAVGRDMNARVDVLHPRPPVAQPVPAMAERLAGLRVQEKVNAIEAAAEQYAAAARALYQSHCVALGLPLVEGGAGPSGFAVGFEEVSGDPDAEVARHGRLADLIVTSRPDDERGGAPVALLQTALFATGRPVLLAPPHAPAQVGKTVALGWSDTRESARALAASLPFLGRAKEIQVLSVHDGDCDADPIGVERYLARHGVAAKSRTLEPDYREIGEQMLDEAVAMAADLLVIGAYGHSRLRELVMGGVTRTMIEKADIPVLMVH